MHMLSDITILVMEIEDCIIWKASNNGELSLKMTCDQIQNPIPTASSEKCIWNKDVPPSTLFYYGEQFTTSCPLMTILLSRVCRVHLCALFAVKQWRLPNIFSLSEFSQGQYGAGYYIQFNSREQSTISWIALCYCNTKDLLKLWWLFYP